MTSTHSMNDNSIQDTFFFYAQTAKETFLSQAEVAKEALLAHADEMPKNTRVQVLKSFVFGFAVGTAVTANPLSGLGMGVSSAIATLVHAATGPLFKKALGKDRLTAGEEVIRGCISFIAAGCVGLAFGSVSAIESVLLNTLIHAIRVDWFNSDLKQTDRAHVVPMFV